jgi:ABC-type sulfate transport system permease component
VGVENTLMAAALLAVVVALVATTVAWRAGRRARRAADLVAQLLDPPVVESVATPAPTFLAGLVDP